MTFFILCVKIFLARIVDVTMGTFRMIFIVRNKKILATLIAFVEVLIWFAAAKLSLTSNSSILVAIVYALGYSIGTLIGTHFSNKFNNITCSVWAVVKKINKKQIQNLKNYIIDLSIINLNDKKKLLYIEINNKKLKELTKILKQIDANVFITQNENKIIQNGFIK